jgi:uncharacterized protein
MTRTLAPGPGTRAFVAWTLRHGWLLWLIALALALPATVRTVSLYRHLKSDIEELLPRGSPSVRALDEMRARLPGLQYLGVVVEVGRSEDLPAGERFLSELAARLRNYPSSMVRDVRTGSDEERAFVERHAPLYVDLADLREVLRRIEARRDYEVERESGALLDESEPAPSLDVTDIEKGYDKRLSAAKPAKSPSGRLSDPSSHISLLLIEAGEFTTGAEQARALLARVKADVLDLSGRAGVSVPGMRVGYCSDIAISVEELDALEADLSVSSVLVIIAEIAVIMFYYRWWKSVLVLFPPLLLATVYAFGLASLPPANVTELNSNTAFLGSIIIGNGINVGIVLLARYRERRRRGESVEEALVNGVWGARLGTLAAALAAAASYASLAVTEFRGFRQFGFIGAAGMIASWVTAFVLMPPLLKWIDRDDRLAADKTRRRGIMGWVAAFVERWPMPTVAVALAMTAASAVAVCRFDPASRLEYDFSKLRRVDTWQSGDGYWGRKVNGLLGRYVTPTVVLSDSAFASKAAERAIRRSADDGALQPVVASVRSVTDVLPEDQEAKLDVVRRIREALTPKIRSELDDGRREQIDKLLGPDDLSPIRAGDLPHSFTAGLRDRDGTLGRTLLVFPRPTESLWRAKEIHDFVHELRQAGASALAPGDRPGRVAGSIPLSDDIIASIDRDAPLASLVAFAAVVGIVVVVLRGKRASLHVIGSLVVGLLWLVGAMTLFDVKVNFCNFVAYPITIGIGVDYSVNVITRYVQDGERDVTDAIRSTGAAVGLCSLTTMIGYASLLLAKNRALYLFGLTAVFGEITCLTAAVIALPACIIALRGTLFAPSRAREDV